MNKVCNGNPEQLKECLELEHENEKVANTEAEKKIAKEEKEKKAANPAKNNEFALDMLRPRMSYRMNVAKPNDQFIPTPFSKGNAEMGCFCGRNDCSFALHYAVFSTETDKK